MADARPDFDDNAKPLTDGIVAVQTTATPLRIGASLNALTEYLIVENLGDEIITIRSNASVVFGSGLRLRPNQKATLSCNGTSIWYGITDTAPINMYLAEMGG